MNGSREIVSLYRQPYDAAQGPQVEGLMPDEIITAADDTSSLWLRRGSGQVPTITPIQNNGEYNKEYFARFVPADTPVYYLANRHLEAVGTDEFEPVARTLIGRQALIVTDYETKSAAGVRRLESMLAQLALRYQKHEFIDSRNNSPASVPHYAGKAIATHREQWNGHIAATDQREAYARISARDPKRFNVQDGVGLVTADMLDESFMQGAWEMYDAQFTRLIEENPSMQAQTRDDLERTMRSDESVVVASFDGGVPVSMGYFVADIRNAYWLRPEFYEEKFPCEVLWYFPGIVTKPGFERKARATSIADLGTKIAFEQHIEPVVTFQCTNVSNDYIPPFFKAAIEGTGHFSINFSKIAEYRYVGYSFPGDGSTE